MAAPRGRGAGINPQFPRLIFRASTQYFSPRILPLSILSAAALKTLAAFLSASSLLPIVSWELKACTEDIAAGLDTTVAERLDWELGCNAGCAVNEDNREESKSLACDISPSEMLASWVVRTSLLNRQLTIVVAKSPCACWKALPWTLPLSTDFHHFWQDQTYSLILPIPMHVPPTMSLSVSQKSQIHAR